ncbi:hypothetical protein [Lentibacillus salinarum]|uniref:DUF5067 domain-containing protein n=1 Tax=Lentibacillus salinarum TaxID=446820 RepID=A0ABW3ZYG1_9BACI
MNKNKIAIKGGKELKTRFGILILITILAFILSACDSESSNTKTDTNTISSTDLSNMEKAILSTTSDNSFVFNFSIDSEYKKVSAWIEKYEDGELVDDKLSKLSSQSRENGAIILTTPKKNEEAQKRTFNIGINTSGDTSGSTGSTIGVDKEVDNKLSVSGSFQVSEKSAEQGETVLAGIIYSKQNTISLRSNFYEDPNELKKYDVVYLFKAEFTK